MELAVELAVLKDALKTLNTDLEAMFRRIAHESVSKEALEKAVDEAEAALARVHKHRRNDPGLEAIAQNRTENLSLARSRLDAFNSDSWATRLKNLERAKARMRATATVPEQGGRWRGPLMQRALQNGTPLTLDQLKRGFCLASVRYLRRVADLSSDVLKGADDHNAERGIGESEAVSVHHRWCKAALLSRAESGVATSTSLLTDLWLVPDGVTFQQEFESLCAAATHLPHVVHDPQPPWEPADGIPDAYLLPPAKHIFTRRATFRDIAEAKCLVDQDVDLIGRRVDRRVRQAYRRPPPEAPAQSMAALLENRTAFRLMRRDAVAQSQTAD